MQINLPRPNTQFEKDLTLKLNQYLSDLYNKIDAQRGSEWDGLHPVMGKYHIWVDATGDIRIKSSQPLSDTDGTIIGVQS